jgi:hypothetical protein
LFLRRGIHRFIQPHVLPVYSLSCHISFKKGPKARSVKGCLLSFTDRYTKTYLAYAMSSKKTVKQTYISLFPQQMSRTNSSQTASPNMALSSWNDMRNLATRRPVYSV